MLELSEIQVYIHVDSMEYSMRIIQTSSVVSTSCTYMRKLYGI